MNKITLTDFTGGLQELTAAEDFSSRQWSILKGFVYRNAEVIETQWPVQTVGNTGNSSMQAVFPLGCEDGMYLVAIKTDGTLWWCKAPAHDATYTTANAVTWTQITTAKSRTWAAGNTTVQPFHSIVANPELRFICAVPVKAYNYIRTPQEAVPSAVNFEGIDADLDNPAKDKEDSNYIETALFSGVLLNTAEKTSGVKSQQQIVLFVDTAVYTDPVTLVVHNTPTVEALCFPNYRRFPMRSYDDDEGFPQNDFISAAFLNNDDVVEVDTFPTWPTDMAATDAPEVDMHPYIYVDIDDTLLPGRGIIPRANVGCMKNEKLILGDIEWFANFKFRRPTMEDFDLGNVGVSATELILQTVQYRFNIDGRETKTYSPTTMGGTIYNGGEFPVFFGPSNSTSAGVDYKVRRRKREVGQWPGPFNLIILAAPPGPSDGSDGDYAYDTVTDFLYGPRAAGAWPTQELQYTSADAVPTSQGITGNYYIDTTSSATPAATWDVYGPYGDVVTLTVRPAPTTISVGDYIRVVGVGPKLNGTYKVSAVNSSTAPYTISYICPGNALADKEVNGTVYETENFYMRANPGELVSIPYEWDKVYAICPGGTNTGLVQKFNVDIAYHFLNDNNTKPYRQSLYFSHSELDEFDPRSVITVGKTDVRIAGLHTIDDTIIAITSAGGEEDGVYRIRGFLSSLNPYDGSAPNPNAVRSELIRGGVGAPARTLTGGHKSYSCLWRAANSVVFIDRLGGVWYTNGRICDRIDRNGPIKPRVGVEADHVADCGEYLFVYRDDRLFAFSLLTSDGDSGIGAWTELIKPSGTIKSMIGGREDLYFINDGKVKRYATSGPDAERGRIDNAVQTLTVGTPTIPSQDEHDRTNWIYYGMTFSTPSSCTVGTVQVQSTGALNATGAISLPTVAHTTNLNKTFSAPAVLGEFVVPAGIGPQNAISATTTFTGHVRLETAAFWFAGRQQRRGDQ